MAHPEFCIYMLKLVCALRQILSEKYNLNKDKQARALIKNIELGRFTFLQYFPFKLRNGLFPRRTFFANTDKHFQHGELCRQ